MGQVKQFHRVMVDGKWMRKRVSDGKIFPPLKPKKK